jgi:hypothetical protein
MALYMPTHSPGYDRVTTLTSGGTVVSTSPIFKMSRGLFVLVARRHFGPYLFRPW